MLTRFPLKSKIKDNDECITYAGRVVLLYAAQMAFLYMNSATYRVYSLVDFRGMSWPPL